VVFINSYIEESHEAAFRCRKTKEKGRILLARRSFEAGEVVLEATPLRIVRCEPTNPTYQRLLEWHRTEGCDTALTPIWYWCALKSLTTEDLGPDHKTEAQGGWDPMPLGSQELLLKLHQAPKPHTNRTIQSLAETFVPHLKDVSKLARCLDAWVLNCFDLIGDDDPNVNPETKEQPGHVAVFLPSMLSHSCFPTCVWHWCTEYAPPSNARGDSGSSSSSTTATANNNSTSSDTNNNDTTNNNITTTTNTTTTTTNKNNNNKLAEHGSPSESDAKPGPSVAELVRDRDRGLRWLLKARRPIRAGAEVTISYLDDTMLLDHCLVRRNELSRRDFWCRCERCVDGIDLSRSMRCSRCQEGVIYARRPSSLEGGSLAGDLARQVSSQPIPLNVSLLRPLRPAIYDEVCAADLDNWLTIGTPLLARNSGKLYYEVVLGSGCAEPQIGWASTRFQEHTDWIGSGIGDDDESWGADGARGLFWHGATQEEVAMEFPKGDWQEGDVIGCALDFEQGVLSFSENGVWSLATKWTFRAEGRWLYPAISLQGNFQMLLHSEALRYGPPSEDFGPWIEEEDVCARGPLDRRGPLRFAYVGCCCDKCGMEVDAAESSRLTDLEQEFWKLADPRAVPSADPKQVLMEDVVNRLRQLADSHFAWHSLVHRARERLLVFYGSRRDYDSQVQVWEEARDFAHHVYPAACGAHAWGQSGICGVVLKEGAAKLFELKTFFDKNPGWNEQPPKWLEELDQKKDIQRQLEHLDSRTRWAIDEAKAAYNTLVLMFGETHTWATEVQDQLLEAESFLMDVKARLDALQQ